MDIEIRRPSLLTIYFLFITGVISIFTLVSGIDVYRVYSSSIYYYLEDIDFHRSTQFFIVLVYWGFSLISLLNLLFFVLKRKVSLILIMLLYGYGLLALLIYNSIYLSISVNNLIAPYLIWSLIIIPILQTSLIKNILKSI